MVDYSSALLKLQRAETHIAELDYLVFQYLRHNPYRIRSESDFETGKHGFYISLTQPPPPIISMVIGDAVHNLRATLDHLVSACAIANGKTANDTSFATGTDSANLEKRIKDCAKKAGPEAMQIIRDLKPYPGGNGAIVDLHKLDLIDKHRAVMLAAGYGEFRFKHIERAGHPSIEVSKMIYLADGSEYFVPSVTGFEHEIPSEIGLSFDVVFPSDGPFGGVTCISAFNDFLTLVREIVSEFQNRCP